MATRSKYKAVRPFSVAGTHFAEGDIVDGRPLAVALDHGDTFVVADTVRTRKNKTVDESTPDTEE